MTSAPPAGGPALDEPDWEEQEVDFRRYWDALVARWWLPVLTLVLGAIVGYAISLGSSQVWKAQATLYLGQPYSASGNVQLQSAQTNPSTVRQIANSQRLRAKVRARCAIRPKVSVAAVSGSLARLGQTPEVTIAVQGAKPRRVTCAANTIASAVVADSSIGGYAHRKIDTFKQQIVAENKQIAAMNSALADGNITSTDKLVLLLQLRNAQQDRTAAIQLLSQAQQVEAPRILAHAAAQKVTARSRRNAVVVAAIIGFILGVIAALVWDAVAVRAAARADVRG
jgi:Chain length determinant protein